MILTSGFVLKTKYDTDKSELEKKVPNTIELLKKVDYNAKISEIEGKILSISSLATIQHWLQLKIKYLVLILYLKNRL